MSITEQGATVKDYGSSVADCTTTTAGTIMGAYYDESSPNIQDWKYVQVPSVWYNPNNKKGGENMRYLYEVILVNPKDDEFEAFEVVAKTETSALMQAYNDSTFNESEVNKVDFDDLKAQCRVLMSWKKEGE